MNARWLLLSICAALVLACTESSANVHDASAPDWWLPSAVPHQSNRHDEYYSAYEYPQEYRNRYVVDGYDYGTRNSCLDSNSEYYKVSSLQSAEKNIDWHALTPFKPHYAPQVPASWWSRHHAPSHQRLFWHHRRTR